MSTRLAQYSWLILQDGNLPLRPDRQITTAGHVCTVTLIWPHGERPTCDNSLVVDPCFSSRGWRTAIERLASVGATPADIGFYYECHRHGDHRLYVPDDRLHVSRGRDDLSWKSLDQQRPAFPGVAFPHCPGHAEELRAVQFLDQLGELWIASDAVLDRHWLDAWQYYWPNGYAMPEIVETWRSVAKIVATADTIVPGHGPPILVDAELVHGLAQGFSNAEYARECPDVLATLKRCYEELRSQVG